VEELHQQRPEPMLMRKMMAQNLHQRKKKQLPHTEVESDDDDAQKDSYKAEEGESAMEVLWVAL